PFPHSAARYRAPPRICVLQPDLPRSRRAPPLLALCRPGLRADRLCHPLCPTEQGHRAGSGLEGGGVGRAKKGQSYLAFWSANLKSIETRSGGKTWKPPRQKFINFRTAA